MKTFVLHLPGRYTTVKSKHVIGPMGEVASPEYVNEALNQEQLKMRLYLDGSEHIDLQA